MTERVRVDPADLQRADGVAVVGERAHHLLRVSRVREGDVVLAFDGTGFERAGRVARAGRDDLVLGWEGDPRQGVVGDAARVRWIQAIPKGDKMDGIVRQAVELGVMAIVPVFSERSVPREVAARGPARVVRWQRIAEEACRQCGRADVPTVEAPRALEDVLAERSDEHRLFAWERATTPLPAAIASMSPAAGFAVLAGPEGGFGDAEAEDVVAAGFVAVSVGPRILRAETAAPAILAMISVLRGDLAMSAR